MKPRKMIEIEAATRLDPNDARIAALEERVAQLEAHLPKRKIALPDNYVCVKDAAYICGVSLQTIYRWCRLGFIESAPIGGRVAVDRNNLKMRNEQLALTRTQAHLG
jgi:hypothetical protein